MKEIIIKVEEKMKDSICNMNTRFTSVRAGRANASILDEVFIDAYGVETKLNQIAIISIPEARQIKIKPYDKTLLASIEKAIYESNVGLTPNNNGEFIFLNIPALTEETRKDYVKQIKKYNEDAKISLRNVRQDGNGELKKEELPEDKEKAGLDQIQTLINKYNDEVDKLTKKKEEELMTV